MGGLYTQPVVKNVSVALRAELSASDNGVTDKIVVWNTSDFDSHTGLNTSTGVYTVPFDGLYQVNYMVFIEPSGPGNEASELRINGSAIVTVFFTTLTAATTSMFAQYSDIVNLSKNDTVSVYVDGDASFNIIASNRSYFSLQRTGEKV